ncbi:MAG: molybdopterin-dependent oxidoreductase [Alphaproteobacteria bacterium]|nr:molybdopterin-dependent oxidoreductase [Alphaproteobacteria bacterium]
MPDSAPIPNGIGVSVPRIEDEALLTGKGRFIDDINLPDQAHAHFVRSPYAHARISSIDSSAALEEPGVIAVFTGADMDRDDVGAIVGSAPVENKDGSPLFVPERRAMATNVARYAGETVAVVIAETAAQAADAAELLDIDYEELPSVTKTGGALDAEAPVIWAEVGSNIALDWETGDRSATDAAFSRAAHVTQVDLVNNRIVVGATEPRGAVAQFDPLTRRYTVYTPTQGNNPVHTAMAKPGLNVPMSDIHLITPDVGGGFGIKNGIYPEQIVLPWAAKKLDRPVKWYPSRSDAFLTDYHARDHVMHAELALDVGGNFLAIRCKTTSSMGAYHTGGAAIIPTKGGTRMLTNVYRIDTVFAETTCVFTNNTPTAAFRGAGKPEFCYMVERLVDKAARELNIDPAELRRRNLVAPTEMPYSTPTGLVYDSGDFEDNMTQALALAGQETLAERKQKARDTGKLLGFGYAVYTEPDGFMDNRVGMTFDSSGVITVTLTGQTNGQGHATVFSQITASQLGLPFDNIHVVQGDSDRIGPGSGTGGSRTTTVAGAGIVQSSEQIIEKGKRIAAQMLEASAGDIEFQGGQFVIAGTDRSVDLVTVAKASFSSASVPVGEDLGLEANAHYVARAYNYPCGCHVAEVEIDRDTGYVQVTRYAMVSDFGTIVNPMLLEGQLHGGVSNGLGQALSEEVVYDPDSGQLLTGSFMDYCMPRAIETPDFAWATTETTCLTNPLGVKGCGESGPTASMPAVVNAIVDALSEFGVTEIDMPVTAEKVWRAINT